MQPLISVIIPVYNRPKELMMTLTSIQKQNYRPLEVIIVDDGSNPAIVVPPMDSVNGISVSLVHQENKGAPAARNFGFTFSKGEYVIFWDADTLGNPDMLQKMYTALQAHPESSFAYSNHIHAGKIKFRSQPFDLNKLKKNNYINTMSLIRRQDFVGFDESLKRFQDWDLFLTLALQGKKGIWIDEYLYESVPTKAGISYWLPKFAYKTPWKYLPFFYKRVKAYELAQKRIFDKHHIN